MAEPIHVYACIFTHIYLEARGSGGGQWVQRHTVANQRISNDECIYMYIYIYIYTHTCMYTHLHTYIHLYVFIYLYINVCIYNYIYTYIHTRIHMYEQAREGVGEQWMGARTHGG